MRRYKRHEKSRTKTPKKNVSIGVSSKWERINMDDLPIYDITMCNCKSCHSLRLSHLVHFEFGDYTCHRCGKDANIRTLFYNCNK